VKYIFYLYKKKHVRGGRCEGSLYDPEGNKIGYCVKGLGIFSNNFVEAYSLWRPSFHFKGRRIHNINRSRGLCVAYQSHYRSSDVRGKQNEYTHFKDLKKSSHFNQVLFFHIKIELNGKVDHWAKVASFLNSGSLIKNTVHDLSPIP
jgi:hypothetical protein